MVSDSEELYDVLPLLLSQKDVDVGEQKREKAVNVMVMDEQCCTIDLRRKRIPNAVSYLKRCNVQPASILLVSTRRKWVCAIFFFDLLMWYGFMSLLRGDTLARFRNGDCNEIIIAGGAED